MLFSQSEAIQQTMENISENQDILYDYSEFVEELEFLETHPINLNSDQIDQLNRLLLINEFQLENLKSYIQENNHLLSVYELILIEGFTKENIETILPFIQVKPIEEITLPNLKQLAKYGRHDFYFRYQRILQTQKGYLDIEGDNNTNSSYLGNPNKYYIKYKYNYSRKFQLGFTAEKDAGELFLKEPTNTEIQSQIENYFHKGFDFNTLHFYGQNLKFIKQIVLGDYNLLFGQGLTLWTGLSFGKSGDGVQVKRFESFIKPNTSSNENGFLRGAAIHFGRKHWSGIIFYSKNKQDATLNIDEYENEYVSSLLNTGLHRTILELSKKNIIDIQAYGGRFKYSFNSISLGFTAYKANLSKDLISNYSLDNLFDFRGNTLANYGFDYAFKWWKAHFYGELALSSEGGQALISGISLPFNSRMKLSLLYRNYERNYQNIFASALAENSNVNNEKGFYAGTQIVLSKKLSVQAYADFFSFPWLKFKQDSPSYGVEYRAQLFYNINPNIRIHFKYKYKQKEVNERAETLGEVNFLQNETKSALQFQINYALNERIELRNRIEFSQFLNGNSTNSTGFLIFQDVNYHSVNQRFGSNTRLALFNTDSFYTAIYAYENDVLYAFSVPAYFGKGIRFYQLLSYALSQKIKCWFRYSLSYFPNEDKIGSGLDEINGSTKSEIKLQVHIKI